MSPRKLLPWPHFFKDNPVEIKSLDPAILYKLLCSECRTKNAMQKMLYLLDATAGVKVLLSGVRGLILSDVNLLLL